MNETSCIVILGAGHAGGAAAALLRQSGHTGQIVLVGEEPTVPYQRPPLSKAFLKGEAGIDDRVAVDHPHRGGVVAPDVILGPRSTQNYNPDQFGLRVLDICNHTNLAAQHHSQPGPQSRQLVARNDPGILGVAAAHMVKNGLHVVLTHPANKLREQVGELFLLRFGDDGDRAHGIVV